MPADWNVNAALEELADAIDEGSVKLKLNEDTRKQVKELYHPGFAARTEAEWRAARSTVLDLAKRAGCCAEAATVMLWVNGVGSEGDELDGETVILVCVMASHLYCPLTEGIFCPDVHAGGAKGEKLDQILKDLG